MCGYLRFNLKLSGDLDVCYIQEQGLGFEVYGVYGTDAWMYSVYIYVYVYYDRV